MPMPFEERMLPDNRLQNEVVNKYIDELISIEFQHVYDHLRHHFSDDQRRHIEATRLNRIMYEYLLNSSASYFDDLIKALRNCSKEQLADDLMSSVNLKNTSNRTSLSGIEKGINVMLLLLIGTQSHSLNYDYKVWEHDLLFEVTSFKCNNDQEVVESVELFVNDIKEKVVRCLVVYIICDRAVWSHNLLSQSILFTNESKNVEGITERFTSSRNVEWITERFTPSNCGSVALKPKIFIFVPLSYIIPVASDNVKTANVHHPRINNFGAIFPIQTNGTEAFPNEWFLEELDHQLLQSKDRNLWTLTCQLNQSLRRKEVVEANSDARKVVYYETIGLSSSFCL